MALDDPDLKSSLEGGGPRSGGGCWSMKIDSEKRDRRQDPAGPCFCFLAFHSAQRAAYFDKRIFRLQTPAPLKLGLWIKSI